MKQTFLFWFISFLLTAGIAIYQRVTGPTYPISSSYKLNEKEYDYKLLRTHGGETDCEIKIPADTNVSGSLFYKRFKTSDDFIEVKMINKSGYLLGKLPNQPPAGKLQYFIELDQNGNKLILPKSDNVVIRFKGEVPTLVLIVHVFFMFGAMLLSVRTGLEFFKKTPKVYKLTLITLGFLFVGGLILGPVVQKYAFGVYWSGYPFGHDLTDNKTVFTFIGWLVAFLMYKKSKYPERWALGASILLIIIYLIPHSTLGSELDYNKLDKEQQKTNIELNKQVTNEN